MATAGVAVLAGIVYWQFYMPSRFLAPGRASLAAVPFECLSPGQECATFVRGFDELLATDLSKLEGLQVVSPSTVRRHQRFGVSMGLMGRLLGLDVLVEGTVQPIGGRIRITSRIVDVHTGKLIWAQAYEYPTADLGSVQAEAAKAIAVDTGAHLMIHGSFAPASH